MDWCWDRDQQLSIYWIDMYLYIYIFIVLIRNGSPTSNWQPESNIRWRGRPTDTSLLAYNIRNNLHTTFVRRFQLCCIFPFHRAKTMFKHDATCISIRTYIRALTGGFSTPAPGNTNCSERSRYSSTWMCIRIGRPPKESLNRKKPWNLTWPRHGSSLHQLGDGKALLATRAYPESGGYRSGERADEWKDLEGEQAS